MEVAPGIDRIESILGPRTFSQYLVRGQDSMLVDTGVVETPWEVILPYFDSVGLDPGDLDFVLNTHADVDHFGGNAAIREQAPGAVFCAHAAEMYSMRTASKYCASATVGTPPTMSTTRRR